MRNIILSCLLLASAPAAAQISEMPAWARATAAVPRKALVLGVATYANVAPLTTPTYDGDRIAAVLAPLNFVVTRPVGAMDRVTLLKAIDGYLDTIAAGDIALVYYSGHGIERNGVNYIIPADVPASLTPGREGHQAISIDWLMDELGQRRAGLTVLVLDACRDDPFAGAPSAGAVTGPKGLAPLSDTTTGFFIGFAAAPRSSSFSRLDSDPADVPSIFTRKLIERLGDPGRSLYGVWSVVGRQVYEMTGYRQKPWHNASLFPELKLVPTAADTAEEQNAWQNAVLASNVPNLRADLSMFLENFPASEHAAAARQKIAEIDGGTIANAPDALGSLQGFLEIEKSATAPTGTSLSGSVTNAVRTTAARARYRGDSAEVVLSTKAQEVRASPNQGAPNVGLVSTGSPLAVLGTPQEGARWNKVLLPSGRVGFIAGVTPFKATAETAVDVKFDTAAVVPIDLAPARAASADLQTRPGRVSISIGGANVPLADRAHSLVYLRALALRGELIRNGLARDRIDVVFGADPDLEQDTARLLVSFK